MWVQQAGEPSRLILLCRFTYTEQSARPGDERCPCPSSGVESGPVAIARCQTETKGVGSHFLL